MAELAPIDKVVVFEALRRFGYGALGYLPAELKCEEATVLALYGHAVLRLRRLLQRNGVLPQIGMAWDSPAMIAAVILCWDVLKAKLGEKAAFHQLSSHLSKEDVRDVVRTFYEKAPGYRGSSGVQWHESHLVEAFNMKPLATQEASDEERSSAPGPSARDGVVHGGLFSIWVVPEDERNARIIRRVPKSTPELRFVVHPEHCVQDIAMGLMDRWAEGLNAIFENIGVVFTVERFDLVALRKGKSVKLPPECSVDKLAPLIAAQLTEQPDDPKIRKCRLYYSVILRKHSTAKHHKVLQFTQQERDELDTTIRSACLHLAGESASTSDGGVAAGQQRALELMYACVNQGGSSLDVVFTASGEELKRALQMHDRPAAVSYSLDSSATVADATAKLLKLLTPALAALRDGSCCLVLSSFQSTEALQAGMSLQRVHAMAGSPNGCLQLSFSLSAVERRAGVDAAREDDGQHDEALPPAKRQKTSSQPEQEDGGAGAVGSSEGGGVAEAGEDSDCIIISDDDEGGAAQDTQAASNSSKPQAAEGGQERAAVKIEPTAGDSDAQAETKPTQKRSEGAGRKGGAFMPRSTEVDDSGQELVVPTGAKVLLQIGEKDSEVWKLGIVVRYDYNTFKYELRAVGGQRFRRKLPCRRSRLLPGEATMLTPRPTDTFRRVCRMLEAVGVQVAVEDLVEHNKTELPSVSPDDPLSTEVVTLPRSVTDQLNTLAPAHHEWVGVVESRDDGVQPAEGSESEAPNAAQKSERGVTREGDVWRVATIDPQTGKRHYVGTYQDEISAAMAYDESMVETLGLEEARPYLNYESQQVATAGDEGEGGETEWSLDCTRRNRTSTDSEERDSRRETQANKLRKRTRRQPGGGQHDSFSSAGGSDAGGEEQEVGGEDARIDLGDVADLLTSTPSSLRTSRRSRTDQQRRTKEIDLSLVGREVRKKFGDAWFLGMVTFADEKTGWFTVRYVDGDIEELYPESVESILLPAPDGSKPFLWDASLHKYRWERNVVCDKHWRELDFRYSLAGEVFIPTESGVPTCEETDCQTLLSKARLPKNLFQSDSEYKRQLSDGAAYLLEVFDTGSRGWGVRALEDIPKDVAVIEYAGEIVSRAQSRRREAEYFEQTGHQGTYIFELNLSTMGKSYVVDATKVGNAGRFVNHGCGNQGNLQPVDFHPCVLWPKKLNLPYRIALVSTRKIRKGEELLYDYNQHYKEEQSTRRRHVECHCGGAQCRGRIF